MPKAFGSQCIVLAIDARKVDNQWVVHTHGGKKPSGKKLFTWAKEGQERVLAIRLKRPFFDELLSTVVPSSFATDRYPSREVWQAAVSSSEVRLQWDPDHDPLGAPVQRRAIQLGLRGEALRRYATSELISIEDMTDFVVAQRPHASGDLSKLITPMERVYIPADPAAAATAAIDAPPENA